MPPGASGPEAGLTPAERDRMAAFRSAERLADLVEITGAGSEHRAYFEAKREWRDLRGRELAGTPAGDPPGADVSIEGRPFHVHGITHADTGAERAYLRDHVSRFLDAGAAVYCEQGIRSMYFDDLPAVCAMDDYRWAMRKCRELDVESHVPGLSEGTFDGLVEDVDTLTSAFRDAAFSLIESGRGVYGREWSRTLGAVASAFLTSHEDAATAEGFESFALSRRAAEDPDRLVELQRHYERAFLPQPVEREWLRRHDPELEVVTHARNERMADYAVYHREDAEEVHLIVGAAHQPGVRYYLERHRDGARRLEGFEPFA